MIIKTLLMSLFLLSCASTLKEEDCIGRDWTKQGLSDSSRGLEKTMYETYINVCSQEEDPTTLKNYLEGYLVGAKKYCTYHQGKLVGESQRTFPSVCKIEKFDQFTKGYNEGKKKGPQKRAN